ncbi:MAG TPA: DUF1269 domain-containing protein [Rhodocyclaceae bacterium]|nr:DUF1269 domain-containing protein [Rhodocyclaceae bacterium]
MRRRLYFMLPDLASANKVADELLLARIEDKHMHFLARRGTPLGKLHEAGYRHKSDLLHAAEVGLISGGSCGFAIGCVLYLTQPLGMALQPIVILGTTLFFALFGAWSSSMVGVSLPNSHLTQFSEEIEGGKILLMVDVPRDRVEAVRNIMRGTHPEAHSRGFDPAIPVFP